MKDPIFYKITRPILAIFIKLYRPTIIGKEFIPKEGRVILAGNHTSYLDPLLVAYGTKRCVHYFAKDSLYKGIKKPIFKGLGIIPVNRKIKDKNSLYKGIDVLNNDLVVGIFPEGTINKTDDIVMNFKFGAVKMAYETNSKIVPFSITHKYKFLKKSVKIEYGKPYNVSSDLKKENDILMKKVKTMIIKNSEEVL
jgi:1-acyl-sn-glycerol-3-phosphate acyltransferase